MSDKKFKKFMQKNMSVFTEVKYILDLNDILRQTELLDLVEDHGEPIHIKNTPEVLKAVKRDMLRVISLQHKFISLANGMCSATSRKQVLETTQELRNISYDAIFMIHNLIDNIRNRFYECDSFINYKSCHVDIGEMVGEFGDIFSDTDEDEIFCDLCSFQEDVEIALFMDSELTSIKENLPQLFDSFYERLNDIEDKVNEQDYTDL